MLQFTSGNIFDLDADILVNTVNCVGVMGCGVALEFKRRHPRMFRRYVYLCRHGYIYPGSITVYDIDDKIIINLATKDHWKKPSQYSYITRGLKELAAILPQYKKGTRVALPALGCGHGGLDWDIVKAMITQYLGDLENIDIYVFQPQDSRQIGRS